MTKSLEKTPEEDLPKKSFHTKEEAIVELFIEYCHFFLKDTRYSLFDGRSFKILQIFMRAYVWILNENVTVAECMKLLVSLQKTNMEYSESIASLFGELSDGKTCVENFILDQNDKDRLVYMVNMTLPYIFRFHEAYDMVAKHTKSIEVEVLLIEFNNFMAHLLQSINSSATSKKENILRGISHLHRATLDGYKEIIGDYKEVFRNPKAEPFKTFLDIRASEIKFIGHPENKADKIVILNSYKELCKTLLNTYDIAYNATSASPDPRDYESLEDN